MRQPYATLLYLPEVRIPGQLGAEDLVLFTTKSKVGAMSAMKLLLISRGPSKDDPREVAT
jgi:hypothetical protein